MSPLFYGWNGRRMAWGNLRIDFWGLQLWRYAGTKIPGGPLVDWGQLGNLGYLYGKNRSRIYGQFMGTRPIGDPIDGVFGCVD